ncbi:MAG: methionine-R-sulfoxide reductase [Patescibacteria group bacterium]|nr:methionine-R-sulfoxide reductase [Patescibacteria group bacterium]
MHKPLSDEEKRIILDKGTEAPFSGKFVDFNQFGTYLCRQCESALYCSENKFNSGCGWPSFDMSISGAVKETFDKDGVRTEITCNNCGGHLGHIFRGEHMTDKNTRHCVNSTSMEFIAGK